MRDPPSHLANLKRPLPTGCRANSDEASDFTGTSCRRCSGSIATLYTKLKNCSGVRLAYHTTAVSESRTLTESIPRNVAAIGDASVESVSNLNVKRTSPARTGCPSCHRALGLI